MPYYSFKVRSSEEVLIPSCFVVLGAGIDVFNATVPNLEEFLGFLRTENVEILEVHQLDGLEAITPDPEITSALLGGSSPELMSLGYTSFMEQAHGLAQPQEETLVGAEERGPSPHLLP